MSEELPALTTKQRYDRKRYKRLRLQKLEKDKAKRQADPEGVRAYHRERYRARKKAADPEFQLFSRKEPIFQTLWWVDRIKEQYGWEVIFDLIEAREIVQQGG